MTLLANGNPFINAYVESDFFGKAIFLGLFLLSTSSWIIICYKYWIFFQVKKLTDAFIQIFSEENPLTMQFQKHSTIVPHPLFEVYKAFKQKTLQIINRNHYFAPNSEVTLSEADLAMIESDVSTAASKQIKILEKNIFILNTIVTLGPFLGLLGTVWGILLTFSDLQTKGFAGSNTTMLAGLSMALATTVIGLVVAIPALIGYNFLKNESKEFKKDLEAFCQKLITSIELQYRKPDHAQKTYTNL